MMEYKIRQYSPDDREAIRNICCETGFSGNPVDPLFNDRDVFADFFTRYYTDWEPETALVLEVDGKVVGYIIGCCRYNFHAVIEKWILLGFIVPKVAWRLLTGKYNRQNCNFLKWCCLNAAKETPSAPKNTPHFHLNFLPDYRNLKSTHQMVFSFVDLLAKRGYKQMYGQIQTFEDRRPTKVFERFGFILYDQKQVTKFSPFHNQKVYVSTFVKELV